MSGDPEYRLIIDDVPPPEWKRKADWRCVALTGFDPAVMTDLDSYAKIEVVAHEGTRKYAEELAERLVALGVDEGKVGLTFAPAPSLDALKTIDDDMSLAVRFLSEHQHVLRYVGDVERWIAWNGTFWGGLYDKSGEKRAKARLQRMLARLGRERAAEILATDPDAFKLAVAVEAKFRGTPLLDRVWRQIDVMAQDSEVVTVVQADLNRDPYLLNATNGLVDLRTGELRPHDPDELCTAVTRVPYEPEALAWSFGWFLAQAQPKEENRHYLRRRAGLKLLGFQRTHVFLVDIGLEGRNGKGVLAGTERWVMGSYATTADSALILVGQTERHPTVVASLVHRRYVWIDETRQTRSLDAARIKEFSGAAPRKAYFMRKDEFEYEPSDTLLLTTNYMPKFEGADKAFMARVQMLPWDVSFRGREDEELPDRLKTEGEGVLAWMVRGCVEYLKDGLRPPPDVLERTEAERREHDPEGSWLDEHVSAGVLDGPEPERVQTKWLAAQYLMQTGIRPSGDVDFTKSFGKALGAWIRGKQRDEGWKVAEDQWREPLVGRGRGWVGIKYEE